MHAIDPRSPFPVYQVSAYFKDGHREVIRNILSRQEALECFNEFIDCFENDENMFVTDMVVTRMDLTRKH
jgi:hypothetical protein